jgi:ATP-dependent Zn protease
MAQEIDEVIQQLRANACTEADNVLSEHSNQLDVIAVELLEREVMDREIFQRLLEHGPLPC